MVSESIGTPVNSSTRTSRVLLGRVSSAKCFSWYRVYGGPMVSGEVPPNSGPTVSAADPTQVHTSAELAASLPQTGGWYVYLRESWGRLAAFLFGWSELVLIRASSSGAIAIDAHLLPFVGLEDELALLARANPNCLLDR